MIVLIHIFTQQVTDIKPRTDPWENSYSSVWEDEPSSKTKIK